MRLLLLAFLSLAMTLSLANCSRDNKKKPERVSRQLRWGPNKGEPKGGSASANGCNCDGAAKNEANGTARRMTGQGAMATGSVDLGAGTATNRVTTQVEVDLVAEEPTAECRLNINDPALVEAMTDEQKAIRFCDAVRVEAQADGSIDLDTIEPMQTNTKADQFAGLQLEGQESNGIVTATYTSSLGSDRDANGRDLLVLSFALSDKFQSFGVATLAQLVSERDLKVKVGTKELKYLIDDQGRELSGTDYELRLGQDGLVFVRIINLELVQNLNHVVEISYKKN